MIATKVNALSPIAADVYEGLTSTPKCLPAKLFYDATGSALFEEITRLPEYYLTRTEAEILRANAPEICALAGKNVTVIELAAGSAEKTVLLLGELEKKQLQVVYVPVDVSPAALLAACDTVDRFLPRVSVQPVMGELSDVSFLARYPHPRLVLFIGSTIGNLEDGEAVALLACIAAHLGASNRLLLGTDLAKDPRILLPAYNDAAGVTARFNLNLLTRINQELGATFDPAGFAHVAVWNAEGSRIEMHLEASHEQNVWVRDLGLRVRFAAGERIHTENSYKYTLPRVAELLARGGFELQRTWTDKQGWYGLHLAQLAGNHSR
jgi:L-histidine N-alpha-methyltransferase